MTTVVLKYKIKKQNAYIGESDLPSVNPLMPCVKDCLISNKQYPCFPFTRKPDREFLRTDAVEANSKLRSVSRWVTTEQMLILEFDFTNDEDAVEFKLKYG